MEDFYMVINPLQIEFYLKDKEYKEFKVLNHYDKTHKFKVSYDKHRYSVVPSEFKIDPQQKVICKIKPLEKISSNGEAEQIFIQMYDDVTSQPLAIRPLTITLSSSERTSERDNSLERNGSGLTNEESGTTVREVSNKKKTLCVVFLGLLLLTFLPVTEIDTQSLIPEIFHISMSFRMICVFLMGVLANEFYHLLD